MAPGHNTTINKLRTNLIDRKGLIENGDVYVFQKNEMFSSPSSVASQVLVRNANRQREINHLGLIFQAFKGMKHTRFDYCNATMCNCRFSG